MAKDSTSKVTSKKSSKSATTKASKTKKTSTKASVKASKSAEESVDKADLETAEAETPKAKTTRKRAPRASKATTKAKSSKEVESAEAEDAELAKTTKAKSTKSTTKAKPKAKAKAKASTKTSKAASKTTKAKTAKTKAEAASVDEDESPPKPAKKTASKTAKAAKATKKTTKTTKAKAKATKAAKKPSAAEKSGDEKEASPETEASEPETTVAEDASSDEKADPEVVEADNEVIQTVVAIEADVPSRKVLAEISAKQLDELWNTIAETQSKLSETSESRDDLDAQLAKLKIKFFEIVDTKRSLEDKSSAQSIEIMSLNRDREAAVMKRDEALQGLDALQKERDQTARARAKAEEERVAALARVEEITRQSDEAKALAAKFKEKFSDLEKVHYELKKSMDAAKKASGKDGGFSAAHYAELDQERTRLRKTVEDERKSAKKHEDLYGSLKERYQKLLKRNERLDEKVQELLKQVKLSDPVTAVERVNELEAKLVELEQMLQEAPSVDLVRTLEVEVATVTDQRDKLRSEVAKIRAGEISSEIENLRAKLSRVTEDRNHFRGKTQRLESTLARLKTELDSSRGS